MSLVRSRTSGRRYSNRSASRSLLTRRSANRTFAKKKTEWIVPFSATCGRFCATPGSDCPNAGSIVLMTNAELISKFEDTTRIVRIEGDLWFQPTAPVQPDCPSLVNAVGSSYTMFRMGLKKQQAPQGTSGIAPGFNPLRSASTPEDLSDYGDGRWAKLWPAHTFQPRLTIGYLTNPYTCCAVVTQDSYVVPPTASGSQPTYTVPAITTSCQSCDPPEDRVTQCLVQSEFPLAHHIKVAYNRPIRLNNDNSLVLYFGWETLELCGDTVRKTQLDLQFHGQLRMLMEK